MSEDGTDIVRHDESSVFESSWVDGTWSNNLDEFCIDDQIVRFK